MNAVEFKAAMDAVDLTASDAREQIMTLNAGLMESNTTLLGESVTNKAKTKDALDASEILRQQAVKAEEERLKLAGDFEGFKTLKEQEKVNLVAAANQQTELAQNALMSRDKSSVIAGLKAKLNPNVHGFIDAKLDQMVSITYDENGKAVAQIKDGEKVFNSVNSFFEGSKGSEWDNFIVGTTLNGANTKQSTNTSTTNPEVNVEAEAAKKRGDGIGTLNARLKGRF